MATVSRWCRICGVQNRPNATVCRNCGRKLDAPNQGQRVPRQQPQSIAQQRKGVNEKREKTIMNWRSPRLLIVLVIIFVLLIGVGVTGIYLLNKASTDVSIVWQSSTTSLTQQDQQNIQDGLKSALMAANSGNIAGHEFTIIDAKRQGDWAIFSASERTSQDTQPLPTEPLFFLAYQQGTTWTVLLPSSPNFCNQLNQVPDTLLNATDKGYFC